MNISLALSVVTCLVFGIVSFFLWKLIVQISPENKELKIFSWVWLSAAGIVVFMGLRTLFFGLGFIIWDLVFALIDQLFLVWFFVACFYFIAFKFFRNKRTAKILAYYIFLPLASIIILSILYFMWGKADTVGSINIDNIRLEILKQRQVSDWGSEYAPPPLAMAIASGFIASIVIILFYDIISSLISKIRKIKNISYYDLGTSLSIIIFVVALVFDQRGVDAGWKLLLFRTVGMFGVILAYLTISGKFNQENI